MDSASSSSPVLTLEQAAEYLHLAPEDLLGELQKGNIPGLQIAGKWRLRRDVLDRMMGGGLAPAEGQFDPSIHPAQRSNSQPEQPPPPPLPQPNSRPTTVINLVRPDTKASLPPLAGVDTPDPVRRVQSLPPPAAGRERAIVNSWLPAERSGRARQSDGTIIHYTLEDVEQGTITPWPGDTIECELRQRDRRLCGINVRVVQKASGELVPQGRATRAANNTEDARPQPPAQIHPTPIEERVAQPNVPVRAPFANLIGSEEVQKHYQAAALAATEGNIPRARLAFNAALNLGAGPQVYEAYIKMETDSPGASRAEARRLAEIAIKRYPRHVNFYVAYGQLERRARNYSRAIDIFREGRKIAPDNVELLRWLAVTLSRNYNERDAKEATKIVNDLRMRGLIRESDELFQPFTALERSPRAARAAEFFTFIKMSVGIPSQRNLPDHITDIVVEDIDGTLSNAFEVSGAFLVRCYRSSPTENEIYEASKYLGRPREIGLNEGRKAPLNISIAFLIVSNMDTIEDKLLSIVSETKIALVPLDMDILDVDDESSARSALLARVGRYAGHRDLYDSSHPVSGRRFFGRDNLLNRLMRDVYSGQFIGIYGLRKMGKTSLVQHLISEYIHEEAICYADLQQVAGNDNLMSLYWLLERDLYVRICDKFPMLAEKLRLGCTGDFVNLSDRKVKKAAQIFSEDIRSLLDYIYSEDKPVIKKLVIVLDEIEHVLPIAANQGIPGYFEFFATIRSIAQNQRYQGLVSNIVVAANAAVSEEGYWDGRDNPVFALYKKIYIPTLEENECALMIESLGKGMTVSWEKNAIQMVFLETGGHPFLARSLCSKVVSPHSQRPLLVTEEMVRQEIGEFVRTEDEKLRQIVQLLHTHFPDEEKILERIALSDAPIEVPDSMIAHLKGYYLINGSDGRYSMRLNLLRRWIRYRHGLEYDDRGAARSDVID